MIVNSIKESVYKGLLTYSEIFISVTSVIELCVHDALDDIFHIIAVFLAKTLQHLWPRLTANPFSFLGACEIETILVMAKLGFQDKRETYRRTSFSRRWMVIVDI